MRRLPGRGVQATALPLLCPCCSPVTISAFLLSYLSSQLCLSVCLVSLSLLKVFLPMCPSSCLSCTLSISVLVFLHDFLPLSKFTLILPLLSLYMTFCLSVSLCRYVSLSVFICLSVGLSHTHTHIRARAFIFSFTSPLTLCVPLSFFRTSAFSPYPPPLLSLHATLFVCLSAYLRSCLSAWLSSPFPLIQLQCFRPADDLCQMLRRTR